MNRRAAQQLCCMKFALFCWLCVFLLWQKANLLQVQQRRLNHWQSSCQQWHEHWKRSKTEAQQSMFSLLSN